MSYDQKKGRSQIGNLTPDQKPLERRGQMSFDWGVLYIIGKDPFEGYNIFSLNSHNKLELRKI
jgi:hypothetical protein